jgi:hypothetical protein
VDSVQEPCERFKEVHAITACTVDATPATASPAQARRTPL